MGASMTRSCCSLWSGHRMQGSLLLRSGYDGHVLVLCIEPWCDHSVEKGVLNGNA